MLIAAALGIWRYWPASRSAAAPQWRDDGRELFFHAADGYVMAVPVETGTTFSAGTPVALFAFRPSGGLMAPYYTVTSDGQRFLISTLVEAGRDLPLSVIVNWHSLLPGNQ